MVLVLMLARGSSEVMRKQVIIKVMVGTCSSKLTGASVTSPFPKARKRDPCPGHVVPELGCPPTPYLGAGGWEKMVCVAIGSLAKIATVTKEACSWYQY